MKIFLRKVIIFITVPIFFICVQLVLLNYVNNRLNNYKIEKGVKFVFVGDSHIQNAIDDKLLPNSINLSQSAEATYYTYYKIQEIIFANPSIKTIYLGVSYHNISSYYDDFIYGKYAKAILPKCFFFLPTNERIIILYKNLDDFSVILVEIFLNTLKNLMSQNEEYPDLGNYENKFKDVFAVKKSMNKRIATQFYENNKLRDFSTTNIEYLLKINDLCKSKNIELIVLNTPLHDYYKSQIPYKFIEKYNQLVKQNNLRVINFEDLKFNGDCFIPDGDHVSEKGALQTTMLLSKNIKEVNNKNLLNVKEERF